jgi:uncharacterized delta-60 repeat protein
MRPRFLTASRRVGAGTIVAATAFGLIVGAGAAAAPGDLDSSFGTGGTVVTSFTQVSAANAIARQADGKVVAAGFVRTAVGSPGVFAFARYNADGSQEWFKQLSPLTPFTSGDVAAALVVQPDGKIVAAGSSDGHFALVRLSPDGSMDESFGTHGTVTTDLTGGSEGALALAIQPDGKLIAGGFATPFDVDFALVRYNPDGSLDGSFGSGGKVTTNFVNGFDRAHAIALQPVGKILLAGNASIFGQQDFALARYNVNGSLDTRTITDFANGVDSARGLAVQPDGKIIAAGLAEGNGNIGLGLARYAADGSLDSSFGTAGKSENGPDELRVGRCAPA